MSAGLERLDLLPRPPLLGRRRALRREVTVIQGWFRLHSSMRDSFLAMPCGALPRDLGEDFHVLVCPLAAGARRVLAFVDGQPRVDRRAHWGFPDLYVQHGRPDR